VSIYAKLRLNRSASLVQELRAASDRPRLDLSTSTAPIVFLMPPAAGSSLELARFRAAFKGRIRFVTIEYPDWRRMIDGGVGFEALVDAAVSQVCAVGQVSDRYLLAGYSFGGLVALEVARRLLEHGRQVDFLGLIDTRATKPLAPNRWRAAIATLVSMSAFRSLKVIGHLAKLLPARRAHLVEQELNARFRMTGMDRLGLESLQVPVTLYKSDESPSLSPNDWWPSHCSQLEVVAIGGTHHSILESPRLDTLRAHFLEAIDSVNSATECAQVAEKASDRQVTYYPLKNDDHDAARNEAVDLSSLPSFR
jgi:thioesterase domain-containing protein